MVAAVAAAAALWVWRELQRPHGNYEGGAVTLRVEEGASARAILTQLEEAGVIADARLGRLYLRFARPPLTMQAGEYLFEEPATLLRVLERLAAGDVATYAVTLVEGLTLEETAQHLAAEGFGELEVLLAEFRSPARIADLDPAATDLEGYLFPDTYSFARGTGEPDIADTLVATFRGRAAEAGLLEDGGDIRRLVILASVVEKEARLDDERPIIAGVYHNRLERGIALYADPTVIFALKRLGRWDGNLRRRDLELDSPYNTYRYPGLPPGPICSPGLASLRAAAAPAAVPYLYFVSRNDGSHVFSETLAEHNRAVETWQRQYWRERWARERQSEAVN